MGSIIKCIALRLAAVGHCNILPGTGDRSRGIWVEDASADTNEKLGCKLTVQIAVHDFRKLSFNPTRETVQGVEKEQI